MQAMDRAHRIGQKKPVLVLRLCTSDSVEIKLLKRATSKLALERLVIRKGAFLGAEEEAQKAKVSLSAQDLLEVLQGSVRYEVQPYQLYSPIVTVSSGLMYACTRNRPFPACDRTYAAPSISLPGYRCDPAYDNPSREDVAYCCITMQRTHLGLNFGEFLCAWVYVCGSVYTNHCNASVICRVRPKMRLFHRK